MTDTLADDFGYAKGTKGVVVTGVHPNSLASDANIRPGMLINKIDNQRVANADGLRQTGSGRIADARRSAANAVAQGGVNFTLLRSTFD